MICVEGIAKSYGASRVVSDVSFACEPGTVTGFVGPNGAGKSTTLRMLCGLARPDAGRATVADRPFAELPNPSRVAGVLLDASAFHPGRSGRDTLRNAGALAGVRDADVDGLLRRVGLDAKAGRRRVGEYSLGMRQRLGLAQTLVADPSVLILDEPANGLDPEGIMWMRKLLREFADDGGTVLLSSHLLGEVEATVDRVVVIRDGRIVADGALDELLAGRGVVARAAKPFGLETALVDAGLPFTAREDGALAIDAEPEAIGRAALEAGVVLTELRPADRDGLEHLFFSLTGDHDDTMEEAA